MKKPGFWICLTDSVGDVFSVENAEAYKVFQQQN
jgi:hypothetical protein